MATCNLGATSGIKVSSLGFVSTKSGTLHSSHGLKIQTPLKCNRLVVSRQNKNEQIGYRCLSSAAESAAKLDNVSEEAKPSESISKVIPNAQAVESLLTTICDTTSIAEFEMKIGGFELYVMRDLTGKDKAAEPAISAPVPVNVSATVEATDSIALVSSSSLALSKPVPSPTGIQRFIDKAADEGLVIIPSPRVGYFRRSRTIKGKRAPPSCKEKQIVKEGQVVCFIEQLGGVIPIESDVAGEVIRILAEDGAPVGYGEALIAILPSFPGIKKLQ